MVPPLAGVVRTDLCCPYVLSRGRYRLPLGSQQEADDLLSERTPAATRKAGLLLGHVRAVQLRFFRRRVPQSCPVSLTSHCSRFRPLFAHSGLGSLQPPALCHTNNVSSTLGPSLSVTHLPSSSAPSMTLLLYNPVKRSSCPGEQRPTAGPTDDSARFTQSWWSNSATLHLRVMFVYRSHVH